MARLYVDEDRYGASPNSVLVEAVRNACLDLVRSKLAESGDDWASFVFGSSERLITAVDFEAVERRILDSGYRFDWSAVISQRERPDAYKAPEGMGADVSGFSFEHPEAIVGEPDGQGREQRGIGDNVVKVATTWRESPVTSARASQVIEFMRRASPPERSRSSTTAAAR